MVLPPLPGQIVLIFSLDNIAFRLGSYSYMFKCTSLGRLIKRLLQ